MFLFFYIIDLKEYYSFHIDNFKSMSCVSRKHQFPRNFLCWQAPGCIVYSFKSMISSIEQLFFYICTYYRGHHRKGTAILNANDVLFNKKVDLINQKCIFEHFRKGQRHDTQHNNTQHNTLSITHSA